MHAVISDVGQRQHEIVLRLPLQVQAPILRVGQFVRGIISAEQIVEVGEARWRARGSYRLGATAQFRLIVNQRRYARQIARRRRKRGRPERSARESSPMPTQEAVYRNSKRFLGGDAERTADPQAGAGGKLREVLAPVSVDSEAAAHHDILQSGRAPGESDAWGKHPLPAGERRVADAFETERLVVSRHHQADSRLAVGQRSERIARKIVFVIRRIEVREQTVRLVQRTVPIPAQSRIHGQIRRAASRRPARTARRIASGNDDSFRRSAIGRCCDPIPDVPVRKSPKLRKVRSATWFSRFATFNCM